MSSELRKELELQRPQPHGQTAKHDPAASKVNSQIPECDHLGFGSHGLGPPKNRTHPRNEFAGGKRFREVVVGSQLEANDPIGFFVPRGQDQNRNISAAAEPPAELESVEVRQTEVEHDEPRLPPLDSVQSGLACAFADDVEARLLEVRAN